MVPRFTFLCIAVTKLHIPNNFFRAIAIYVSKLKEHPILFHNIQFLIHPNQNSKDFGPNLYEFFFLAKLAYCSRETRSSRWGNIYIYITKREIYSDFDGGNEGIRDIEANKTSQNYKISIGFENRQMAESDCWS